MNVHRKLLAGSVRAAGWSGGFTLVEMVTAMAIASILLVAVGSVLVLTAKAVPAADSPQVQTLALSKVLDRLAEELSSATSIIERDGDTIAFTVADRDNDGQEETIRYDWAGNAGDPLTRQYNSETAVAVAEGVQAFSLSYAIRQVTETTTSGSTQESAEKQILAISSSNGGLASSTTISDSAEAAQYLPPGLGLTADATSWKLTRIYFQASGSGGANEDLGVALHEADANGAPSGSDIGKVQVPEGDLSGGWYEVPFDTAGLSPGKGYCIVFSQASGSGAAAELVYGYSSNQTPDTFMLNWQSGGEEDGEGSSSSWTAVTDSDIWIWVYGTESTGGSTTTVRDFVRHVDISLRTGTTGARASTAVALPNQPEITGP